MFWSLKSRERSKHSYSRIGVDKKGNDQEWRFHYTKQSPRVRRVRNRKANRVARRQRKVNANVR